MSPNFSPNCSHANLRNLYKNCSKSVKIAPSSIPGAGTGLFAVKNIMAGTIICFYPVDGIGVDCDISSTFTALDPEGQLYFDGDEVQTANYIHYLIGSRPLISDNGISKQMLFQGETLFIDVNPNNPVSAPWLSHYINDGAIVNGNNEDSVLTYYKESTRLKNCVHIPFGPSPILATVTTRKVKKGEEFFTSYGCSYWIDTILANDEEHTEITDDIVAKAQLTAKDLFSAMNTAKLAYASESEALEDSMSN